MALLTKGAIMTAFEEILMEMTFDKITVSALVKRSGISSNTFYYHYRDKFERLNEWFGYKLSIIRTGDDFYTWQNAIKKFFIMCRDNPKLIHHVFDSLSREQLEHYIFQITDTVFLSYVRKKIKEMWPHLCRDNITNFDIIPNDYDKIKKIFKDRKPPKGVRMQ